MLIYTQDDFYEKIEKFSCYSLRYDEKFFKINDPAIVVRNFIFIARDIMRNFLVIAQDIMKNFYENLRNFLVIPREIMRNFSRLTIE